uniref:Ig-like domain-containing protein n=1 Tax=Podarcis muralis TaxID=64176 RepID=A0A670HLQ8_PODMU
MPRQVEESHLFTVLFNFWRCEILTRLPLGSLVALFAEAPVVKVTRKADYDGLETLVCQVHGFYPKEIEANWVKDGEVWQEGTLRGLVAPNSDGTYYLLLSVQIDPEEREHFRCRVEHDSLKKPLDVHPYTRCFFLRVCVFPEGL